MDKKQRPIIQQFVDDILTAGYSIYVFDKDVEDDICEDAEEQIYGVEEEGEDEEDLLAIIHRLPKTKDPKKVMSLLKGESWDRLFIYDETGKPIAGFFLNYESIDPEDMIEFDGGHKAIPDDTLKFVFEQLIERANQMATN